MSRTDKDRPWWITAEWYRPDHGKYCIYRVPYFGRWGSRPDPRPCNLPPEPKRGSYIPFYRDPTWDNCTWDPDYPYDHYRYRYTRPPLKRERHLKWYGPVRAQLRDRLLEARKQYQGSGDIDIPEPPGNHRHASIKGWWD